MRLLVLQHIECEHPAQLRHFLARDGIDWTAVELDEGEPIPPLEGFDAMWVMGGPMDVWDIEEHPWLLDEKEAIRTWVVDLGRPFLGLCLGHQLLADALGGTCGHQQPPEIGVLEVALTPDGLNDPIFNGMPTVQQDREPDVTLLGCAYRPVFAARLNTAFRYPIDGRHDRDQAEGKR